MPRKIKAAILHDVGAHKPYAHSRPIHIEDVELYPPKDGEVQVKIMAAGLCHSDLSVVNGNRPRPTPMALGHEAAGIIVETGNGVSGFTIGDHVILTFVPSCGHCLPCAEGRPALCEPAAQSNGLGELIGGGHRLNKQNQVIHHHLGCSAFAEYATVSQNSLVKIDPSIDFGDAALFGCAVMTGIGAAINTAQISLGQSAAIIGLGGVGLAALIGCLAVGANPVIAIDINPEKLALAKELGAHHCINAKDINAINMLKKQLGGGVDFGFEMAGVVDALTLAMQMTKRGGTTVTAGLPPPDASLPVNIVSLVAEERTLKGSYIGSCVPIRDIPRYIDLFIKGRLPVDKLKSGYVKLSDINAAFDKLDRGEAVRQIISFEHNE